jgi:hypothetical protein
MKTGRVETSMRLDETLRVQRSGRDANTPTGCLDSVTDTRKTKLDLAFWTGLGGHDPKFALVDELMQGTVEIAFDHEDRDVIAEADFF